METITPSIHEVHMEAKLLIALLEKLNTGDTLTYQQLSAEIGRDVQKDGRQRLVTARRYMERVHRIRIETMQCVGVRRADDIGCINAASHGIGLVRRACRRIVRVSTLVRDYSALTQERRTELIRVQSTAALIDSITDSSSQKRINVEQAKPIPPAKLMEMLRG